MKAIETEDELEDDEKAEAANKLKTITQAIQNPEDKGLQKKANRAVQALKSTAEVLGSATKLYTACHSILPQIDTFLSTKIQAFLG